MFQALLDKLRKLGEQIVSVSELDLLERHLGPGEEALEAWEAERVALANTIKALKELLSKADRAGAGVEEEGGEDWRGDLVTALVEVYKAERLALEAELHTLRLLTPGDRDHNALASLDNRLLEQVG